MALALEVVNEALGQANGFGVFQPRINRSDHYARFERKQFNSYQREAHKNVNDAAAIQDAIHDFGQTGTIC